MTDHDDLDRDQRRRRAVEIASAARRYVRDCAHAGTVLDIGDWGGRRWRRDGEAKRDVMVSALIDEVGRGVAVVDVWQRFEVSGHIARALVRAGTYADLYRILRAHGMPVAFRPADVATWADEGRIERSEVGVIFGLEDSEIDAFISAWTSAGG